MPADACAGRSQRNRPSSSFHRKTAYTTREMARNLSSVSAQFHETHAYHTCTKIDLVKLAFETLPMAIQSCTCCCFIIFGTGNKALKLIQHLR